MVKQPETKQPDIDEYHRAVAEWEQQVRATYSELGFFGEKHGDQAFMEEAACGLVTARRAKACQAGPEQAILSTYPSA